jgi:hypothetical protein
MAAGGAPLALPEEEEAVAVASEGALRRDAAVRTTRDRDISRAREGDGAVPGAAMAAPRRDDERTHGQRGATARAADGFLDTTAMLVVVVLVVAASARHDDAITIGVLVQTFGGGVSPLALRVVVVHARAWLSADRVEMSAAPDRV